MKMQKIDFRGIARQAFLRAKDEAATEDEHRIVYAAMELRRSIEALTYDRAQMYQEDLPPERYETWQPRKLVRYLIELDPFAVEGASLAVGAEKELGQQAQEMHSLGKETVLSQATINRQYDALGSVLHIPTLAQMREKGPTPDLAKLRARVDSCFEVLEAVFASPIWNLNFNLRAEMECRRCHTPMNKRLPANSDFPIGIQCFECDATYTLEHTADNQAKWTVQGEELTCVTPGCEEKMFIWNDQIKPGTHWKCRKCGARQGISLAVIKMPDKSGSESKSDPD